MELEDLLTGEDIDDCSDSVSVSESESAHFYESDKDGSKSFGPHQRLSSIERSTEAVLNGGIISMQKNRAEMEESKCEGVSKVAQHHLVTKSEEGNVKKEMLSPKACFGQRL